MQISPFVRACCLVAVAGLLCASEPDGVGLQRGALPPAFLTGGPNCVSLPDWEVQHYNEDFYIIRESGCVDAEKPFLYLVFGQDKALLEDTGVGTITGTGRVPLAQFVTGLIEKWAAMKKRAPVSLVVIHSHGHGDHTAGDPQFVSAPGVQFIAAKIPDIQKVAGIVNWPADIGHIDLGARVIDVIPIPGHQVASIALYDRLTGNLLTGDSLYPGRLYVPEAEIPAYAASAHRLADFVRDPAHPIAHVLGTHIEQTRTPYLDYPTGTVYQPEEHSLELTRAHVFELNDAFIRMNGNPQKVALPDFTIVPRGAPAAPAK